MEQSNWKNSIRFAFVFWWWKWCPGMAPHSIRRKLRFVLLEHLHKSKTIAQNIRIDKGTETVQMDNPARTRGVSKVPWKCGICCLLLWTCAEGERYCGYSEKLILEKNFILDKIMLSHVSRHFFGNQSIHQRWHALKIFQPGQTKGSRFSSAVTKHWWPVEFSCAHAGPLRRCPSPSKTHQFQNIDHYLVKHASTYNTVQVRAGKSEGREKAT